MTGTSASAATASTVVTMRSLESLSPIPPATGLARAPTTDSGAKLLLATVGESPLVSRRYVGKKANAACQVNE